MKLNSFKRMSFTALLSALCYIGFMYLRIDIPVLGGSVAIHFGNTFLIVAALLLGGVIGGLAGAIGMSIADLLIPQYAISAPKTFILKLCIGLIVGYVAHHIGKINQTNNEKNIKKWVFIASLSGMLFNILFEPIITFLYNYYILDVEYNVSKIFASWMTGATILNAITSIIIANILYHTLRKIFNKM